MLLLGRSLQREERQLGQEGDTTCLLQEDAGDLCVKHAVPSWLQSAFFPFTSVYSSP